MGNARLGPGTHWQRGAPVPCGCSEGAGEEDAASATEVGESVALTNRGGWALMGNAIGFAEDLWYPCDEYDGSDLGFADYGPTGMQQCLWL